MISCRDLYIMNHIFYNKKPAWLNPVENPRKRNRACVNYITLKYFLFSLDKQKGVRTRKCTLPIEKKT